MQALAWELWKPQPKEARSAETQTDTQALVDGQGWLELLGAAQAEKPKDPEAPRPLLQGQGRK